MRGELIGTLRDGSERGLGIGGVGCEKGPGVGGGNERRASEWSEGNGMLAVRCGG